MSFTVIGDVHGKHEEYLKIIRGNPYTLQLGDMGFKYDFLNEVDPERHKFHGGNHDSYDTINNYPHNLGDWGTRTLNGLPFFFIRGAFSIDWQHRKEMEWSWGKTWWENEQLNLPQMELALADYKIAKPEIMITHSCPRSISELVGSRSMLISNGFNPDTFTTNTQELLQACFEFHQPKIHVFGHMHRYWTKEISGTKFICLPELGTVHL